MFALLYVKMVRENPGSGFAHVECAVNQLVHVLALSRRQFCEEEIDEKERKKVLITCLGRIDPELREALWLVYAEDMSYSHAAEVMGVNTKRVDHLLLRGKLAMKKELKEEGITDVYE